MTGRPGTGRSCRAAPGSGSSRASRPPDVAELHKRWFAHGGANRQETPRLQGAKQYCITRHVCNTFTQSTRGRWWGCGTVRYFLQGDARVAASAREGRQAARRAGPSPGRGRRRCVSGRQRDRGREGAVVSERRPVGLAERPVADAARGAGDDQAPVGGRGSAGVDVLSHVPGDGDHGVTLDEIERIVI